jgi:hypothetical protein
MYIGVTLLVSAMNDLKPNDYGKRKIYSDVIIIGAVLHAIIQVVKKVNSTGYEPGVVIIVNVGFLVVALAIGLRQYLLDRSAK